MDCLRGVAAEWRQSPLSRELSGLPAGSRDDGRRASVDKAGRALISERSRIGRGRQCAGRSSGFFCTDAFRTSDLHLSEGTVSERLLLFVLSDRRAVRGGLGAPSCTDEQGPGGGFIRDHLDSQDIPRQILGSSEGSGAAKFMFWTRSNQGHQTSKRRSRKLLELNRFS